MTQAAEPKLCMVVVIGGDPELAASLADFIGRKLTTRKVKIIKGKYLMEAGNNMGLPHEVFLDIHQITEHEKKTQEVAGG